MKLANTCNKNRLSMHGHIVFEGKAARATDIELHAVIDSGEWDFDCATVVSVQQIKSAMALNKKPVWSGDTLNGIKLVNAGDVNDWIPLPAFDGTRIECDALPVKLSQVLPAMAVSDIRYYLNGLCFDHSERAIIGCDGHRLHIVKNAYAANGLTGQAIVPDGAFNLLGAKNIIHMDFSATHCRIGYVGGYLICKLVDGKFPDYSRVLPADSARSNVVPFNGVQIAAAKSIVAVNKANKVKFGTATISTDGALSACDITVPCFDKWTMTPLATKFYANSGEYYDPKLYGINAEYLHDAMAAADHGTIAVDGVNDSVLVSNGDFRAVVMPCRI
jgi:DNA polymerase-3 subunit beta